MVGRFLACSNTPYLGALASCTYGTFGPYVGMLLLDVPGDHSGDRSCYLEHLL